MTELDCSLNCGICFTAVHCFPYLTPTQRDKIKHTLRLMSTEHDSLSARPLPVSQWRGSGMDTVTEPKLNPEAVSGPRNTHNLMLVSHAFFHGWQDRTGRGRARLT